MPALAEFQTRFADALRGRDIGRGTEFPLAAAPGFKVYRNTVIKGLVDVLQANYPSVQRLTGAEWFQGAAQRYALRHLPSEASLALYGADFPPFLAALEHTTHLPYLPHVAQLDRFWTETHFAADRPCLDARQLAALPAQTLATLRLTLHPAARFGRFPHSAVTIWQCNRPPAIPPETLEITDTDEAVLITRPGGAVEVTPLTPAAHRLLQCLHAGAGLNEAAMHVLQLDAQAEVSQALATLINAGTFEKISIQETQHERR